MGVFEYLDHVNSKEDLLEFIVYLQKDFKENKDEWENIEVETYLVRCFKMILRHLFLYIKNA
jgi:hypothetical protein